MKVKIANYKQRADKLWELEKVKFIEDKPMPSKASSLLLEETGLLEFRGQICSNDETAAELMSKEVILCQSGVNLLNSIEPLACLYFSIPMRGIRSSILGHLFFCFQYYVPFWLSRSTMCSWASCLPATGTTSLTPTKELNNSMCREEFSAPTPISLHL